MPLFVVCASPLVKVYLPQFHDRLLDDPSLLEDDKEKFTFDILHGCGAFKVDFNKPMVVAATKDNSDEAKYLWLIGEATGSAQETDIYGLVPFEPGIDLVQRSDEIARLEEMFSEDPETAKKARAEVAKITADTSKALKAVRADARERSAFRIRRAMKTVHNNLVRQWQINEEQKMGKYPPSMTELFGAHVLDAELSASAARGAKIKKRMNEIMGGNINV